MPPHESDDSDYDSDEDKAKFTYKKPQVWRLDKFKNNKKITINLSTTQYPVVTDVAQDLGWKVQYSMQGGDWDVYWTDIPIDTDTLIKMHLFQKINYYPGIHTLARKNLLGMNLMNMKQRFPGDYNFFPLTWMLPQQYSQFRQYYQTKKQGKTRTYIVKPEAECQGRGIFLTRNLEDLQNGRHYVVQRYIAKPYLIQGLKFDLRIYVLLCGTSPLRLYIYQDGLARFATEKYVQPTNQNLQHQFMHLTNYAINKKSPKFVFNSSSTNMGIGHKRSLKCIYEQMKKRGMDVERLKNKINDLIIKTIIAGLPLMAHQYKCCQPEDYSNSMCFHVIGFDVMLDHKQEPQLIQINHTPSFATDTPLDHKIKFALIKDTLKLMHITSKHKAILFNRAKQSNQARLHNKKRLILDGTQRQQKILEQQKLRDDYENKHLGGYTRIYPLPDNESQKTQYYQTLMQGAYKMHYAENTPIRIKLEQAEKKKQAEQDMEKMKLIEESKKNKAEKLNKSDVQVQGEFQLKRTNTLNSDDKKARQSVGNFNAKKIHSLRQSSTTTKEKKIQEKISSKKVSQQNTQSYLNSQTETYQTNLIKRSHHQENGMVRKSECFKTFHQESPIKVSISQYEASSYVPRNMNRKEAQEYSSIPMNKKSMNKISSGDKSNKVNKVMSGLPQMVTSIQRQLTRKQSQDIARATKSSSITEKVCNKEKLNSNYDISITCKQIVSQLFNRQKVSKTSQKLTKQVQNQSQLPNIYDQTASEAVKCESPKRSQSFKIRATSKNETATNQNGIQIKYLLQPKEKRQHLKEISFDKKMSQIPQLNKLMTKKINYSNFKGNYINPQFGAVMPAAFGPGGFVVPKMYQLNVQSEKRIESEKRIQSSKNIFALISRKNVNKNIFPL